MAMGRTLLFALASSVAILVPLRPALAQEDGRQGLAATGYVDTHVHLAGKGPLGAQSQVEPGQIPHAASADRLIEMMDARGVGKCIIVTVPPKGGRATNEEESERVASAVRRHPGRLYLMNGGATLGPEIAETDPALVTDLVRSEFEKKAERILDEGAIGFGEMISLHLCLGEKHSYQWAPTDHPLFLALADIAARRDVPIDVHMEVVPEETETPANLRRACSQNPERLPASLPPFERFLAHNRSARVVWQHVGWDNTGNMTVALLRRMLETHPNLYLSLRVEKRLNQVGSRALPMPNRIVGGSGEIQDEWRTLIVDFPERIMIGSDEFVGTGGGLTDEPHASFDETWSMFDRLPADVATKVGRENAVRVYRLE